MVNGSLVKPCTIKTLNYVPILAQELARLKVEEYYIAFNRKKGKEYFAVIQAAYIVEYDASSSKLYRDIELKLDEHFKDEFISRLKFISANTETKKKGKEY